MTNIINKLLAILKSSAFFNNFVSAFMVFVIVVLSFNVGVLWDKTQGGTVAVTGTKGTAPTANTGTAPTAAEFTDADLAPLAKTIGLDQAKVQACITSGEKAAAVDKDYQSGVKAGVQGTPSTFVYNKKTGEAVLLGGAYPYADVKAAIDGLMDGTAKDKKVVPGLDKPSNDDKIRGNKNANIVLIEYSDFQCPFCKKFEPTVEQAMTEYKDKIALIHRHFPLSQIHPYAQKMAEASECVLSMGGIDKFWTFAQKMYEN